MRNTKLSLKRKLWILAKIIFLKWKLKLSNLMETLEDLDFQDVFLHSRLRFPLVVLVAALANYIYLENLLISIICVALSVILILRRPKNVEQLTKEPKDTSWLLKSPYQKDQEFVRPHPVMTPNFYTPELPCAYPSLPYDASCYQDVNPFPSGALSSPERKEIRKFFHKLERSQMIDDEDMIIVNNFVRRYGSQAYLEEREVYLNDAGKKDLYDG